MKSYLSHLSLLLLLLSVCLSCKSGQEEKKYIIGVSQCTLDDPWRKAMLLDMEVEASYYPNVTLLVKDGEGDSRKQAAQIQELMDGKVDLLIISPNETQPVTPSAVAAYQAGIPTIIIDRKINSDQYTTFIGADNYEIGRSAGYYINSLKEGKLTIAEIWGLEGSSPAQERHRGFVEALSGRDNIVVKEIKGDWLIEEAKQHVAELASFDDIDIVFSHNDGMALSAREVIEKRDAAAAQRIRFIGVDALPGKGQGLEAVMHGSLSASFMYPTGGGLSIRIANQLLNGENVSRHYALSSALIDKNNAGTLYVQSEQVVDYQHQIEKQRDNLNKLFSEYRFLQNSVAIILLLMGMLLLSVLYVVHVNRKVSRANRELKEVNRRKQA